MSTSKRKTSSPYTPQRLVPEIEQKDSWIEISYDVQLEKDSIPLLLNRKIQLAYSEVTHVEYTGDKVVIALDSPLIDYAQQIAKRVSIWLEEIQRES